MRPLGLESVSGAHEALTHVVESPHVDFDALAHSSPRGLRKSAKKCAINRFRVVKWYRFRRSRASRLKNQDASASPPIMRPIAAIQLPQTRIAIFRQEDAP